MHDYIKKFQNSKKVNRNNRLRSKLQYNKYLKKQIRLYQKLHNGINPIKVIPKNTPYCYCGLRFASTLITPPNSIDYICPHYSIIEIPESKLDDHPGIVAVGQTHIGCCAFLNKTDDDMNGTGLLWDMVKECGYSYND